MATDVVATETPTSSASAPPEPERFGRPSSTSRRWVGPLAIIPAVLAVAAMLIPGILQSVNRPANQATERAEAQLAAAVIDIPFVVRQPVFRVGGPVLVNAVHEQPRKRSVDAEVEDWHKLTTWWNVPGVTSSGGGQTIKVWQTNDTFIGREVRDDPTRFGGVVEVIDGAEWVRAIENRVNFGRLEVFSRRFDDGITMSIDATDPELALLAIRSLQSVAKPPATTIP